jgi:hypothetical protein
MFPKPQLNATMQQLAKIIWEEGGFRFKYRGTNFQSLTYVYHCSQDLKHAKNHNSTMAIEKQRDGQRMKRFLCQSRLNMRPCLQTRTLFLSIYHEWHTPYEGIELSPIVQELINSRVSTQTPSEIFREIRDIPEAEFVTRHQVYYLWQKANAKLWQRGSDPLSSAQHGCHVAA